MTEDDASKRTRDARGEGDSAFPEVGHSRRPIRHSMVRLRERYLQGLTKSRLWPACPTLLARSILPRMPRQDQRVAYRRCSCCVRPFPQTPLQRHAYFVAQSQGTHYGKQVHWDGAKDEDAVLRNHWRGPGDIDGGAQGKIAQTPVRRGDGSIQLPRIRRSALHP
jgi:hypothetical protein